MRAFPLKFILMSFFVFGVIGHSYANKKKKKQIDYEEVIRNYIDGADDAFDGGYLDSAIVFIDKADSVLNKYWSAFEKDGFLQEDELLDNYLISEVYYNKAHLYEKKYRWSLDSIHGNIFDSVSYHNALNNYAKVINFESKEFYVVESKKGELFYLMEDKADKAVEGSKRYSKLPSVSVPESFYDLAYPFLDTEARAKEKAALKSKAEGDYDRSAVLFKDASELRSLTPSVPQDGDVLYAAAEVSHAQVFDSQKADTIKDQQATTAMYYFQQLLDMKYTGAGVVYEAVRKADRERFKFGTSDELELMMKTGLYERDTTYETGSIFKDILSGVIDLYIFKTDIDAGGEMVDSVRLMYPYDLDFLLQKATLVSMVASDSAMIDFVDLLRQEINKEILDEMRSRMFYNSGRAIEIVGKWKVAEEFYRKSTVINPKFIEPVYGLGKLYYDRALVHRRIANTYGLSRKDRIRSKKQHREKNILYQQSIRYLREADKLYDSSNIQVLELLKELYLELQYSYEYKQVNDKIDALKMKEDLEQEFSLDTFSI